uniref:Uncharacterized protein n=1 Tax=Sphaerodactylus townsendi TaxID=933632 RepID=A0ACB8FB83_9SAUR
MMKLDACMLCALSVLVSMEGNAVVEHLKCANVQRDFRAHAANTGNVRETQSNSSNLQLSMLRLLLMSKRKGIPRSRQDIWHSKAGELSEVQRVQR